MGTPKVFHQSLPSIYQEVLKEFGFPHDKIDQEFLNPNGRSPDKLAQAILAIMQVPCLTRIQTLQGVSPSIINLEGPTQAGKDSVINQFRQMFETSQYKEPPPITFREALTLLFGTQKPKEAKWFDDNIRIVAKGGFKGQPLLGFPTAQLLLFIIGRLALHRKIQQDCKVHEGKIIAVVNRNFISSAVYQPAQYALKKAQEEGELTLENIFKWYQYYTEVILRLHKYLIDNNHLFPGEYTIIIPVDVLNPQESKEKVLERLQNQEALFLWITTNFDPGKKIITDTQGEKDQYEPSTEIPQKKRRLLKIGEGYAYYITAKVAQKLFGDSVKIIFNPHLQESASEQVEEFLHLLAHWIQQELFPEPVRLVRPLWVTPNYLVPDNQIVTAFLGLNRPRSKFKPSDTPVTFLYNAAN